MKPITARLRKLAGMSPVEWHERGRQLLSKSGERFLGLHQGELSDRTFRRRLLPPFGQASIESMAADVLEVMRGLDFSRRPFMPLFGARELSASMFRSMHCAPFRIGLHLVSSRLKPMPCRSPPKHLMWSHCWL